MGNAFAGLRFEETYVRRSKLALLRRRVAIRPCSDEGANISGIRRARNTARMGRVGITKEARVAVGIGSAATIEIVGDHVAVFIQAVAALRDVVIACFTVLFIAAIDLAITIVIDAVGACARAKFRLSGTTEVARGAIAKGQAIRIGTIDVPIAIVVLAVVANFLGIRLDEDIQHERAFIRAHVRIDGVAIEEHVIRARIQQREFDLGGPLHAPAVVIARDLFARVALARTHIER